MKLGFVGLGKMGFNMVKRLLINNHQILAFDINPEALAEAKDAGAHVYSDIGEMINNLPSPRAIWIMVPSGQITEDTITKISNSLNKNDIIIDGGNSNYKDTLKRSENLRKKGISFLDAGTSGGIWGLEAGYCLMVGGEKSAFDLLEPVFKTLAPENGYLHVGPSGAGHYVKMIHNGIEYAMMQAYAEGFELLKAKEEFGLDLHGISKLWNQGSVVRSWLLELSENAFKKDPELNSIRGYVEDSGEGRWTVENSIELSVPAPVIAISLFERFRSRQDDSFGNKVLAALRNEFGGHGVVKK